MTCSCGHENRPGRKFCVECGAALALACAACNAPYEAGEKFCGECGAPLGAVAPRPAAGGAADGHAGGAPGARDAVDAGARKVVTIVFADLVGSTALHERLDAESARRVMERYYAALRAAVEAHRGTVVKLLGDGVMAAFGLKRVAEDDALRAVRAAAAMQDAFRELIGVEAVLAVAGLRVAVNTGEVVVSGARDDVIGDPVNVAARLQEQGGDGDVVLGEATRRLVATRVTLAPLGSVTLKGRAEAVAAYRLESLEPPAGATAAPFVGRESELTRLEAVCDGSVATPATRLAVLLGSPGLGKSRLIDELGRRHADDATILAAHCDAAGGATFAPLAQVFRRYLGLDDGAGADAVRAAVAAALPAADEGERTRVAAGIAGVLGDAVTSPEETFFVVRRFLAGLAAARPIVLVIDDLHWAEPLLLDLVEHLVQWGAGVPLFVLVAARPELRDLRSSLVTPSAIVADVVTLGGLDAGAAMRLAANVIGAADLPAAVAAKVLATSEGNPLFVGELVRMLVQEGALTKDGDRWIVGAGLASLEMPPTIHALLAARIERLGSEERTVLERASVVGRHFSRSAVAALLGRNGMELDARLESLRRSELIERDTGWLLGEPVMRFHHVLIRDAAYRRLLKGTRAELHARLADWIEGQVGDAPEHDEMIGWHLEQAHQLLSELGPIDAAGAALGERAARRLAAAGRRALARDDVSLAAGLLGRALQRLGADAAERADLVLDWCEALLAAGDVGPAADAIAQLDRVASDARLRAWHACFAGQLTVLTAPEALHATADRVGAAARELAALEDAAGEAKAHFVHAQALARLGKIGASEAALDQALAAARRADDRRRANAVLAGAPLAALWGPSPVTRASGRCLDVVRVLRITQGAPAVEAVALSCQGVLEALRGRTEAARRMLASSRTMVEELGITHRLFETDVFAGRIDLLEGDAIAAERALRTGYEGLRDLGLGIDAARAAALLGRALLALDRPADAERLSHESELLAGDDLQAAIAWRGVRAEALARRGDHAAAITFAEAAVAIAAATDALLDHADARLALAAALRAGGRRAEADAEERRAFELWEAKGATVLAERARCAADGDVPAAPAPEMRPEPRVRRRVSPNIATAVTARMDAASRARDIAAVDALLGDPMQTIDHPNGVTYGREEQLASGRRLMQSAYFEVRHEPLATLGDSLCLHRGMVSGSGKPGADFDVAQYEIEYLDIVEVNAAQRVGYSEVFSSNHLGDAIAGLYRRYAETLPEGPERERAAVSARAVAFMLTTAEETDLLQIYAPTYEDVDHRSVGYGSLSFDEAKTKLRESFRDLVDGLRHRVEDVLALDPNGLVRKTTTSGVWRESGGPFDRTVCTLSVFGPDGRVTNHETFDADRVAEALARFDALTAGATPKPPVRRRVRPNAATASSAAIEAAVARRDLAAIDALLADPSKTIEHPTGTTYGREGVLESSKRMLRAPDLEFRFEPLATLGDALVLGRRTVTASGTSGGRFDVGAFEIESIFLNEVDAAGRLTSSEIFASDHLCQATARLYARYAETLPDGPERTRAAGIARSESIWDGPIDPDRVVSDVAPSFVIIDHRSLGTWSAEGREEYLQHWRGQADLAAGFSRRDDDLLAFAPDANLARRTFHGINRATGGLFENVFLGLNVFGTDGLITRIELFELDREAEALARFDEITGSAAPPRRTWRRVRPNAATASAARLEAAVQARDAGALIALHSEAYELVHHPTSAVLNRQQSLAWWRLVFTEDWNFRLVLEPIATLGDTLVLVRSCRSASGSAGERFDGGAYENDVISVTETDEHSLAIRTEVFALDRLGDAIARLYARHAELLPAGPERERAVMTARAAAAMLTRSTEYRLEDISAPDIEAVDHRSVGMGAVTGSDQWARWRAASDELMQDPTYRVADVLALSPDALLRRTTETGAVRASGGAFENSIWILSVFGSDGRQSRIELFDVGHEAEALARYDTLVADPRTPNPTGFTNAATRLNDRVMRAWAARDWDAVVALHASAHRLDDRRRLMRIQAPAAGNMAQLRALFDVPSSRWVITPIATRGERLALSRVRFEGNVDEDGGPLMIEFLCVDEVDDDGRSVEIVLIDAAHLDAAYAELDARYEAEVMAAFGPLTSPGAYARAFANRDWEAVAEMCTPTFVEHDHRGVALLGTRHGPAAWAETERALVELAPDTVVRFDHVRSDSRGVLCQLTFRGSREGSEYEIPFLTVAEFGAGGKLERSDIYDPEQLDQARARFAELTAPAPSAEPFANAASATAAPVIAAIVAHDWQRFAQLFADDFRMSDRRRVVQLELDRDQYVAFTREVATWGTGRAESELLATRGERLALNRLVYEFSGADVGPSEIAFLILTEVDDRGRIVAYVRWDVEDLDAAYAELDARYEAGEGAASELSWAVRRTVVVQRGVLQAVTSRDWDSVVALCAPTFAEHDHRHVAVLGTTRGGEAWAGSFRALVDLAPDSLYRTEHFRVGPRGGLSLITWYGSREGGDYEIPLLIVFELDDQGRIARADLYDPDQTDQARARFAELPTVGPVSARFANAATRAAVRIIACWRARDWQGLARMLPAGLQFADRRRMALLDGGREEYVEWLRVTGEMASTDIQVELLATRGDRLALQRRRVHLAGGDVGPSEMANVTVIETNAGGDPVAVIHFDEDALDAAYAELDARWRAGEATAHPRVAAYNAVFTRALASRDWDVLAALHAPTLVAHDHRLVGWDVLRGPLAFVGALRAMVDLAPDALGRVDHLRMSERGLIAEVVWVGTRDGGAFESPFIWVVDLDAAGLAERLDFYDPHHLDAAWARFEEIRTATPRAPFAALAKPNAAVASLERRGAAFAAAFDSEDWEAMRALCAADMVFEDRRPLALLIGDRDLMIASARERARTGARPEAQLVGAAGDRVTITRTLWTGGPPDGRFEIEYLSVVEVDAAGLFTAMIFFDFDDARAAQREAWARWAAIDPVAAPWVKLSEAIAAGFEAHDRNLALFTDDVTVDDHRRTGLGRIDGRDAYYESLEALWELAPDQYMDMGWFWPAVERHGFVTFVKRHGTLPDGGAFESEVVWLSTATGGRINRLELFEIEDVDKAVARLAELRPDPLRIPPNAATRSYDRWCGICAAKDWDVLRACYTQGFVFDDRRRLMHLTADAEMTLANARHLFETGWSPKRTVLATAGERLALSRVLWSMGRDGQVSEVEILEVDEVDLEDLFVSSIVFDPEDRAAASTELFERYAASGADGAPPVALDVVRAWNAHDLERLRTMLPADFYLDDRRRTGVGRLDGADAYLASLAALWELSRDLRIETQYLMAVEPHGTLYVCRWFGTNAEGGEFDAVYVCLGLGRGDRPVGLEIFELDDLDAAQARFAELRA